MKLTGFSLTEAELCEAVGDWIAGKFSEDIPELTIDVINDTGEGEYIFKAKESNP